MSARSLNLLSLLPLLALAACTAPIVRDTTAIDPLTAQCDNVDCVVALMDQLPQGPDEARYPFMEGQPDAKLVPMRQAGTLTIKPLNPLWLATGLYGYTWLEEKPLGGMASCDVEYLPGFNWLSLKHELAHCQGYADLGIPIQIAEYTPEQKRIMAQEGVRKWTQTSVYKTGITR